MVARNESYVTVREAARTEHVSREYVRKLIDAGKLQAIRRGGTDDAPRLRVRVSDLRDAIAADSVYIPPKFRNAKPPRVACRDRRRVTLPARLAAI